MYAQLAPVHVIIWLVFSSFQLAALILQSKANYPYASNWLERLRQIKRTKGRLEKEETTREKEKNPWQPHSLFSTLDFTEFTCPRVNS